MKIVFNGMDLIWLAIMALPFLICGIIHVINRIEYAVKKHQQKRIDESFKEEDET